MPQLCSHASCSYFGKILSQSWRRRDTCGRASDRGRRRTKTLPFHYELLPRPPAQSPGEPNCLQWDWPSASPFPRTPLSPLRTHFEGHLLFCAAPPSSRTHLHARCHSEMRCSLYVSLWYSVGVLYLFVSPGLRSMGTQCMFIM